MTVGIIPRKKAVIIEFGAPFTEELAVAATAHESECAQTGVKSGSKADEKILGPGGYESLPAGYLRAGQRSLDRERAGFDRGAALGCAGNDLIRVQARFRGGVWRCR